MEENILKLLALDVGTVESGYAIMELPGENDIVLHEFGKIDNERLLQVVKEKNYDEMAYEQFRCYGMAVGESTIESIIWNGRYIQSVLDRGFPVHAVFRQDEKINLCHSMKAKDANIRQALIDRFAKKDRKNGRGTKKDPDVFYGVSKDVWSAVAVGVTWCDREKEKESFA